MPLRTHSLEFGEFVLDRDEKVLLRNEKPVSITPKGFLLLQALVQDHGHLVEKEQLMKAVWADSFVEEGNLTFTVNLLRRALGDDRHNPRFIETVPRRGYRFIADVAERKNGEACESASPLVAPEIVEIAKPRRPKMALLTAGLITLISAIGIGSWYVRGGKREPEAPVLSAPFSIEPLSADGTVYNAAISSDGKRVVYTNGFKGRQSVWLRQLESGNNIEIIPPSDNSYYGLALSANGDFLYFSRRPRLSDRQADVYRVSVFGGVPEKVVNEAQGWISISPDGQKISFVRCFYREDESCSLWIADALDGGNERKLLSRQRPYRIGDNEFSPDGKTIAFAAGQSRNGSREFGLFEVDIETGAERELSAERFFNIKSVVWLPNQSGLLLTASRVSSEGFLCWQVSASGEVRSLTKDSESYADFSLNGDASIAVATQVKKTFRLDLYEIGDRSAAPRVLTDAASIAFAPDGKIVYSSSMTGNGEIWSINADGSEKRQLTNNRADDSAGVVSPDNAFIFFTSNRTGEMHIWRMKADGSNQTQITTVEGGFPVRVSNDGQWLYYSSALNKTLRRVLAKGGEEQLVLDRISNNFAVSPDGSRAAFPENNGQASGLTLVSLDNGQTIGRFPFADRKTIVRSLAWSQDDKYLAYILTNGEMQNNSLWFQPLGQGNPRRIADLGDDEVFETAGFALSSDGKSFATVQGAWKHDAVLLRGLK